LHPFHHSISHLKVQQSELLFGGKKMKARVNFWAKFREAVRQFHHRFACGEKKSRFCVFAAKPPNCDQSSAISIHGRGGVYNRRLLRENQ
jgi:hypothetical protein